MFVRLTPVHLHSCVGVPNLVVGRMAVPSSDSLVGALVSGLHMLCPRSYYTRCGVLPTFYCTVYIRRAVSVLSIAYSPNDRPNRSWVFPSLNGLSIS